MNNKISKELIDNCFSYENFENNLEILMERFPEVGFLSLSFSSDYTFFKNDSGVLNIRKNNEFFYSSESILDEVYKQSKQFDFQNEEILYIYGIGLGYSYVALKHFLEKNIKNTIIFIEDNDEVFFSFLHTDIANKILSDPQVNICFLNKNVKKQSKIEELAKNFPAKKFIFTTDILSKKSKKSIHDFELKLMRASFLSDALFKDRLYSQFPFQNFIQNIRKLTESFYGNALKGAFKSIPALIVGAGPSLELDLEEISKLENKALIFAGGSALSALSSNKIIPHIGLAFDPNYEEFQRMQTNLAQEIPFFYSTRVHPQIFSAFNGLLGYLRSGIGGICELWMEEELNLSGDLVGDKLSQEALSVTTIALALAEYLGCNPIILVGCDLSFSNGKRYAKGVENIDKSNHNFDLIKRKSIHNKIIQTTTHWIMESNCIAEFAKASDSKIYNATNDGIGFKGIENILLKNLKDQVFKQEYDLRNLLFFTIQANAMEISGANFLKKQLKELQNSILRCKKHLITMLEELDEIESDDKLTESGKLILSEMDLKEEDAFNYLFYDVNQCLNKLFERTYKNRISKREIEKKRLNLFLEKIEAHLDIMKNYSNYC
jgi:hypothetical protein